MMYLISVASMRYTKLYELEDMKELMKHAEMLVKARFNIEIYECHKVRHLPNFISDVMSAEVKKELFQNEKNF